MRRDAFLQPPQLPFLLFPSDLAYCENWEKETLHVSSLLGKKVTNHAYCALPLNLAALVVGYDISITLTSSTSEDHNVDHLYSCASCA